jgi:hypothetical protein
MKYVTIAFDAGGATDAVDRVRAAMADVPLLPATGPKSSEGTVVASFHAKAFESKSDRLREALRARGLPGTWSPKTPHEHAYGGSL